MLGYYITLALRSFKSHKALTALMVLAIALGIGASMTTLTVYHVLSGDPIPGKSGVLFHPQLEPRSLSKDKKSEPDPPDLMTRFDAEALLREKRADRQAIMGGGELTVFPENGSTQLFTTQAEYTTADFFPMFNPPMLAGRGWFSADDESHARVAVISRDLAQKMYGSVKASLGRQLRTTTGTLQVIGVLDAWGLNPKFYDLSSQRFNGPDQVFVPFSTSRELGMSPRGSMECWDEAHGSDGSPMGNYALNVSCVWLEYWVELDTPEKAAAYRQYLNDYSAQQQSAGRFERVPNTRLPNVMSWLDYKKVVPNDVRLQMWLAFGFLLVCLVNTIGLMLAKFLRESGAIGVRRALGAPRAEIFKQCLVEAGCVGFVGALLGLLFAGVGLWLVRQQPDDYASLAHLDTSMLLIAFVISIATSILAGLLPAWRAMQVVPAVQLKLQ